MAIGVTFLTKILPLPPVSLELQDLIPVAHFISSGEATGDASGGAVTMTFQHKAANADSSYYFEIKDFIFRTSEVTASKRVIASIGQADWEDLSALTNNPVIFCATLEGSDPNTFLSRDRITRPIYIGRPTTAGTASINVIHPTNTDTKIYLVLIRGSIYGRPLRNLP